MWPTTGAVDGQRVPLSEDVPDLEGDWGQLVDAGEEDKRVSDAMSEIVESAEGRESMSRRIVVKGDVGVRRRWAEKMGQLRAMIAILQGTWTYQGGEVV